MPRQTGRRTFIRESIATSAAGALALTASSSGAAPASPTPAEALPQGKIGKLSVSRLLLGGNLLTHYTHSRDLRYVYALAAKYNTDEKILETLALAEANGINTLSVHTVPHTLDLLKQHRKRGGKIQWIICPTAPVNPGVKEYAEQVKQLVDMGTDAIYLWGVHADRLVGQGKAELIGEAVEAARKHGLPSGVGGHDLRVVEACERLKVPNDFYIKTLHHHKYPSGPKPEEIKGPYQEDPGYWCSDPEAVIERMKTVEKPWIAFKVMAAGAISPTSGFKFVLEGGADFVLAGMFDFEIRDDMMVMKSLLARELKRQRPWRA
ncbi:MAG TPA: hypothetical protein VM031_02075 [Phycisphaerae bacterium]|nr:hypothetical protein [Phycisphaerae bacterium]